MEFKFDLFYFKCWSIDFKKDGYKRKITSYADDKKHAEKIKNEKLDFYTKELQLWKNNNFDEMMKHHEKNKIINYTHNHSKNGEYINLIKNIMIKINIKDNFDQITEQWGESESHFQSDLKQDLESDLTFVQLSNDVCKETRYIAICHIKLNVCSFLFIDPNHQLSSWRNKEHHLYPWDWTNEKRELINI